MGIDTSVFTPRGKKRKRSDEKLIIAVGRLITCKGYRYLLLSLPAILRKIKHLRLLMIGTGPEETTLQALTQKLKIQKYVRFLGNISHADLAEYYKNSDLFMAPAVTDPRTGEKEGQGLAILEAMASGVPVVASRSGGIKYIVQNNVTGILVPERDVNALSTAVIGLLRKKSRRDLLVKNGLREIRRIYTWEKISKSFDTLFDRIVNHA
jgi:glycosyltransferase involved in cell wall biosynthesis